MIIPDVNLLLYAVITGFAQHPRAHAWWEHAVNSSTRIGLTHPALFGFLQIATNARISPRPYPWSMRSPTSGTGSPNQTWTS